MAKWRFVVPQVEVRHVVGGGDGILLGGPKYAAYEVGPGRPLSEPIAA